MKHNHNSLKAKMQKNPNKTFKDLKQKQKAKISECLYIETLNFWRSNNRIPTKQEFDSILDIVYEKIKSAAIWIPYKEVAAYYQSRLNKYSQRIQRETSENSIQTLNSKQADKTVSKHKNTYRRKKNARKTEKKSFDFYEFMDDQFAFIAGYTDGGMPYGLQWEDVGIPSDLPFEVKKAIYLGKI